MLGLGAVVAAVILCPVRPVAAAGLAVSTTSLSSSAPAAASGQTVTLTARVSGRAGAPGGSVTFAEYGSAPLGAAMIVGDRARLTVTLPDGLHTIVATYAGDEDFLASSASLLERWGPLVGARVLVSAAPDPAPVGTPVTLTASVGPVAGAGTATGDVTFSEGSTVLGAAPLGPPPAGDDGLDQIASFVLSTLPAGAHSITASYTGDGNVGPATSDPLSEVVGQPVPTTTTLDTGPQPAPGGQPVAFTVSVTAAAATSFPTGTVALVEDGATLASAALGSGGSAQLAVSGLAPGAHRVVASYTGDQTFAASASAPVAQVVLGGGAIPTAVSVTASGQPVFGQSLTVTAAVAPQGPGTPTGTVTFTNAGSPIGSAPLGPDGAASLTFRPPSGYLSLGAAYAGDATFASSATPFPLGLLTQHAASALQLSSSPDPAVEGQPVTLTARVAAQPPAATVPTGQVTFIDAGTPLGSVDLDASGTATLSVSALPPGSHALAAQYLGDNDYDGSDPASLVERVARDPAESGPHHNPNDGPDDGP